MPARQRTSDHRASYGTPPSFRTETTGTGRRLLKTCRRQERGGSGWGALEFWSSMEHAGQFQRSSVG
ncbi:hypothetical protein NDU88_004854 [Pleurodeles waltl]|uniref:Uncharacterized protein n=1 Tax=Pleurodeles waltl TaxID=8319 RepID=A0AAV7TSH0_PLEWA|nr:hypothetical protein NDU88_004854 [Pleurodeles waltl]